MGDEYQRQDRVLLPPTDAEVLTTACDYCIVACGYKVFRWPVDSDGGTPERNGLGVTFPRSTMAGGWISPNQHNVVTYRGERYNIVVVPDWETRVVNPGGDHSIRGGCIAQKVYNPDRPTRDRLKHPMVRVNGELTRVDWDTALDVAAQIGKHVIERHGAHAWAMKMFSYGYFENTYALTRLALQFIRTPAYAVHDNPSDAPSAPGFEDTGFDIFAAAYEDFATADVLLISGTDPYETKTVLWNEWIMRGIRNGMKVIFINPRKTTGVAYGEQNGGLHLWNYPGSDTPLHMAIARVIVENGWEDREWIDRYVSNKWESDAGFGQGVRNTPVEWRSTWDMLQSRGFDDWKQWLLQQEESRTDVASRISGVSEEQIRRAAELMAKPRADGSRPKTSVAIEKGNYWSNNYLNTASIAALAICCGTGNRPGQVISRLGGHQRGGRNAAPYPINRSPEKFFGRRRRTLDLDRWLEQGKVRFAYVIGCTWINAMTASGGLDLAFRRYVGENEHHPTRADKQHLLDVYRRRVDSGGLVLANQEVYLRPIGRNHADIVFPASGWGEVDLTRNNGERRLRLYSKFYDPPEEAKPDWWIAAQIGRRMGFEGFEWEDSNAVFEESGRFGRGSRDDYYPLVWLAKRRGIRAHDLLRSYGTTGIQCPIRYENGELVGTVRLHDSTAKLPAGGPQGPTVHSKWLTQFDSHSGLANITRSPWSLFADFYAFMQPRDGELWITNGRVNEIWQSGFDDVKRRPYITERWPDNFIELHPDDAAARGIENGDEVVAECDRIPVQTGGFIGRDLEDQLFEGLRRAGHIRLDSASVRAVAVVIPVPRPGVAFMYFLDPRHSANTLVPRVPDPLTNNYRYKIAVGRVRKTGESPYKRSLQQMSFATRNIL